MRKALIVVLLLAASILAGSADEPVWPPLTLIFSSAAISEAEGFVDQIRQAPPDLLQSSHRSRPLNYLNSPWSENGTEEVAGVRERWLQLIAEVRRDNDQLHEAGCQWIIPYVCNMTAAGDHEKRLGLWWVWDHWDECDFPELGFGSKPPDDPLEWVMRNPKGDFWFFYQPWREWYAPLHRYAICPSNPYWRQRMATIAHWDAEAGYDGVFVDNGGMHCYCKHCQAGFKDYIRGRYTEGELQEQLGVENFDEIEMGTEGPLLAEVYRFWAVSLAEHFAGIKRGGAEVRPGFVVIPNALGNSVGDYARGRDPYIWRNSIDGAMAEGSVPPGFAASMPIGAGIMNAVFSDNILPYKIMAGLPGRKVCTPIQYKTNPRDPQQIGLTMAEAAAFGATLAMTRWNANTGPWNDWRQFLNANRVLYENVRPIAPVALLLSFNDMRAGNSAALAETDAIRKALQDQGVPYLLLEVEAILETDLSQFEAVVTPNVTCLGDAEASTLVQYVRKGGKLIASGAAGSRYWAGAERPVSALAEVLPAKPGRLALRKVGSGLCIWNSEALAGSSGPLIAQALFKALGRCPTCLRPSDTRYVYLDTWQRDDGTRLVHLVNYNPEPVSDLELLLPWPARRRSVKVVQYAPGQSATELTPTLMTDGMLVSVDKLEQYAVLAVSGLSTGGEGTGSIAQLLPQTSEEVTQWAVQVTKARSQLVCTTAPPALEPAAPETSTTPDQELTFLRHQGVYLIRAQAGEQLAFTVHSRLRSGPSGVEVVVFDPQGKWLSRGYVPARGTKQFKVVAPTTGTYILALLPAPNACAVEIANRYTALSVDEPANFFRQPAQQYFWVPESAKAFTLSADARDGGFEGAKVSVLRPDGTVAGTVEGALDDTESCEITVPPDAAGAVWSLKAGAPEGMTLEDFRIQLSGDCVPLLSDAPGRVVRYAK